MGKTCYFTVVEFEYGLITRSTGVDLCAINGNNLSLCEADQKGSGVVGETYEGVWLH